ncbi:MAG: DUF134 domain-containing protein [Polyangiaceae bacterium]|nr:DUF134 domain-containing protein [Polyangiaceae bacterium]
MPRPPKPRAVAHPPATEYFKPRGIPMAELEERVLALDELEALRLVDLESMSQEEAGEAMGISRGTIGRLLERGRRTVVDALLHGHALRIEGGPVVTERSRRRGPCCAWNGSQTQERE